MDVRVDELADFVALGARAAGVAARAVLAVEVLEEGEGEGNPAAAVVLVEHDGVGDPAGIDHPGKGLHKAAATPYVSKSHLSRPAIKWARSARYDFSSVSGSGERASTALSTYEDSFFSARTEFFAKFWHIVQKLKHRYDRRSRSCSRAVCQLFCQRLYLLRC